MSINRTVAIVLFVFLTLTICSAPALAVSENDVQAQVASEGRETVSGNLFIWFLCAIAFLKISQKIDSFMSSLGINVGRTGGSMMAELMIAARGAGEAKNIASGGLFRGGRGSASGVTGALGAGGSLVSGGLAGIVSRQFTKSAVNSITNQNSGGNGLGAKLFNSSVQKGGDFANNVISNIANGNSGNTSLTGENAAKALSSYMGYSGQNPAANTETPAFSDVEIRNGHIGGTETTSENPSGISFGMYNADKYMKPDGAHTTVEAADGSKWYKQYAADTVDRTPYMEQDGSIAYKESLVKKLPKAPQRKDKF